MRPGDWFIGLVLALLFLASPAAVQAQQQPGPNQSSKGYQPEEVGLEKQHRRSLAKDRLAQFREQEAFDYQEEPQKAWLRQFLRDLLMLLQQWKPDFDPGAPDIDLLMQRIRNILYVVLGLALLTILFVLIRNNYGRFLQKAPAHLPEDQYRVVEDSISGVDFDTQIAEATNQGRYAEAIRLHYLKILGQLDEQGRISWQHNKTNHDYLRELKGQAEHPTFRKVTRIFEYVWYGQFPLNQALFHQSLQPFQELETQLNRSNRAQ